MIEHSFIVIWQVKIWQNSKHAIKHIGELLKYVRFLIHEK